MTDVDVHLNIAMTPRLFRGALFLFLLAAVPGELASESVTLNSYYPAPSGIYTQMITTGNTYLARDGGYVGMGPSAVVGGVGTMAVPGTPAILPPTKLIIYGNVAVGKPNPAAMLEVSDSRNAPIGVGVTGTILTGDGANQGGVWLNYAQTQFVGTTGGSIVTLASPANTIYIDNAGHVGLGLASPILAVDVNGPVLGRTATINFSLP